VKIVIVLGLNSGEVIYTQGLGILVSFFIFQFRPLPPQILHIRKKDNLPIYHQFFFFETTKLPSVK